MPRAATPCARGCDPMHWRPPCALQVRSRVQPCMLVLTTRPMAETDPAFREVESHVKDLESLSELARPHATPASGDRSPCVAEAAAPVLQRLQPHIARGCKPYVSRGCNRM